MQPVSDSLQTWRGTVEGRVVEAMQQKDQRLCSHFREQEENQLGTRPGGSHVTW